MMDHDGKGTTISAGKTGKFPIIPKIWMSWQLLGEKSPTKPHWTWPPTPEEVIPQIGPEKWTVSSQAQPKTHQKTRWKSDEWIMSHRFPRHRCDIKGFKGIYRRPSHLMKLEEATGSHWKPHGQLHVFLFSCTFWEGKKGRNHVAI